MTEKLKSCPCKSNDLEIEETLSNEPWPNFFIICNKCGYSYGPGSSEEQIIEEWNINIKRQ